MKPMVIQVKVVRGTKFSLGPVNPWSSEITLHVKSPFQKGLANREIESQLKAMFGSEVSIVSGFTSPHKKIRIHASESAVKDKLSALIAE